MPQGGNYAPIFRKGSDKYITTDAVRLKQVLNNLINNAKKFTVQGSITLGYRVDESDIPLSLWKIPSGYIR